MNPAPTAPAPTAHRADRHHRAIAASRGAGPTRTTGR